MSPTLLELVVVILLLVAAWQIGMLLTPRVMASLAAFWRNPTPPVDRRDPSRPEKNVTPPNAPGVNPSPKHDDLRK